MQYLFILIISIILIACSNSAQKVNDRATQVTSLRTRTNSIAFNKSFKPFLNTYFQLKDNFIAENDLLIDSSGKKLMNAIDSVKLQEINDDSTVKYTAQTYMEGIKAELIGLLGERQRDAKLKSFQMISEQLYNLIRTVQFDGEVIYYLYCPTAFKNDGASWISNLSVIINPYLSSSKLDCGELRDSIDFRRKN